LKLSILFGGISYEHEISIVSAITLKNILKNEELLFIFLDSNRDFYQISPENMMAKNFSDGKYKKEKKLNLIKGGFESKGVFRNEIFDDLKVINLIHGGQGEDGTIFSLLEFHKIKTISPNREASTLSYDKSLTKIFAKSIGVKTLEFETLHIHGDRKLQKLQFPVIVKPLSLGSSLGVSVVEKIENLDYALDTAFEFEENIIIEPFIKNVKEVNLAGTFTDKLVFSNIEEPQKGEILDFETKYMDFSRDETVSKAEISKDLEKKLFDSFEKIYLPYFLGSLIRCDFFIIDDEVFLNEINSIPGSFANYLFPNFIDVLNNIYIPTPPKIENSYKYINQIQKAKG